MNRNSMVLLAVCLSVVTACGGGGGSGAAGNTDPRVKAARERAAQPALETIGAPKAYQRTTRGGDHPTGHDIRIAVVDSGIQRGLSEFVGRVDNGYDLYDGNVSKGRIDRTGHGTAVASIIGAARDSAGFHGVAPRARLIPIRIFDKEDTAKTDVIARFYADKTITAYLKANPRIANNSWSTAARFGIPLPARAVTAVRRLTDKGVIQVWAAGNSDKPDASREAGLPAIYPGLKPHWLAVVAVDKNNRIADFGKDKSGKSFGSNRCGRAQDWCLAAPGVLQTVLKPDGTFARGSGTSFAAPYVSGALAILMELFPGKKSAWYVKRLLETATDLGAAGPDKVYGRGLLNLDAASSPAGTTSVATGRSLGVPAAPLADTRLGLGAAFGDGPRTAFAGQSMAVFDSQGAPFRVDLTSLTRAAADPFDHAGAMAAFGQDGSGRQNGGQRHALAHGVSLAASFTRTRKTGGSDDGLGTVTLTARVGRQNEIRLSHNRNPAQALGLAADLEAGGLLQAGDTVTGLTDPWSGFAARGQNVTGERRLANGDRWRAAAFTGRPDDHSRISVYGLALEYSARLGPATVNLRGGAMLERDSLLGSRTTGAFKRGAGSRTLFGGLDASLPLTGRLALLGSVNMGWTRAPVKQSSLFADISNLRAESFALGAVGTGILAPEDRLGFIASQPLRVATGAARLAVPDRIDRHDNIYKRDVRASLAPRGRELDLEVFYSTALADQTRLSASAMLRRQPGHRAAAKNDGVLMLRLKHDF